MVVWPFHGCLPGVGLPKRFPVVRPSFSWPFSCANRLSWPFLVLPLVASGVEASVASYWEYMGDSEETQGPHCCGAAQVLESQGSCPPVHSACLRFLVCSLQGFLALRGRIWEDWGYFIFIKT